MYSTIQCMLLFWINVLIIKVYTTLGHVVGLYYFCDEGFANFKFVLLYHVSVL